MIARRFAMMMFLALLPLNATKADQIGEFARSIIARAKAYDILRFKKEIEASELDVLLLAQTELNGSVVRSVVFSQDGRRIISVAVEGSVTILDSANGDVMRSFVDRGFSQYGVALRPDGKRFATCGDMGARIWDMESATPVVTLTGHTMLVLAIAFSPDGSRVATASADDTARVWDANNGKLLLTLTGHGFFVNAVAFSPDGKRIATASEDKTARIWDAVTGNLTATLSGHEGGLHSVAFSPNGARLVTGSMDHTARVWDIATGKTILTLGGQPLSVIAVFSPDGSRVATGSDYDVARIWDASNGRQLAAFYGGRPMGHLFSLAYSPNGQQLAAATWDGFVQIWTVTPKGQVSTPAKK